jgi:hypothetical protein
MAVSIMQFDRNATGARTLDLAITFVVSEEEFSPRDLADGSGQEAAYDRLMSEQMYVFKASRWTAGNFWFPLRIEVTPQRVSRIKPRLIGSNEESISISQVASVSIRTGFIWSTIQIDSTGGTDPIVSRGHSKADAIRIRDLIERFQQGVAKQ